MAWCQAHCSSVSALLYDRDAHARDRRAMAGWSIDHAGSMPPGLPGFHPGQSVGAAGDQRDLSANSSPCWALTCTISPWLAIWVLGHRRDPVGRLCAVPLSPHHLRQDRCVKRAALQTMARISDAARDTRCLAPLVVITHLRWASIPPPVTQCDAPRRLRKLIADSKASLAARSWQRSASPGARATKIEFAGIAP